MTTAQHTPSASLNLRAWCEPSPSALSPFREPFTHHGYLYATDRRAAIRIPTTASAPPDTPDESSHRHFEETARMFNSFAEEARRLPLRPMREWPDKSTMIFIKAPCPHCDGAKRLQTECRTCHGSGATACHHCGSDIDCDTCDGTGSVGEMDCDDCHATGTIIAESYIRIDKYHIDAGHYRLVSALPYMQFVETPRVLYVTFSHEIGRLDGTATMNLGEAIILPKNMEE